nr:MAG TPA: replisome organizer [Caudoviricetes sp.]
MADVKWIKLSTGLPDNRKIKQIRTLPDGDTIALMWIFLMCLAGNSNDDGFVFFTKEIPYTDEMLAEEFKMDINTIRLGLATFEKFGMIEIVDDFICLSAWEKWQSTDKLSELKEYNRIKKRESRARKREEMSKDVIDMSLTCQPCQGTDIDKDGLACINHIFVVVVELCGSVLNAQVVLNVSVLVLFYIYIEIDKNRLCLCGDRYL